MNLIEIAKSCSPEQTHEILNALKNLQNANTEYDKTKLNVLFKYWHKFFPNQKMNMGCKGCVKSVVSVFTKLKEHFEKKTFYEV
mgnify:CR=1 FL=1